MIIEFLFEVVSSVAMLQPLYADVGHANIVKVVGAGMKVGAQLRPVQSPFGV